MSPVATEFSPVPPFETPRAFVKDKVSTFARLAKKSDDVACVMSTTPSVLEALLRFWIVEEAERTIEVPVALVNVSCGKVLAVVVVAVKKFARTSPRTSSFDSDEVAVPPINTWFVVVAT